MPLIIAIGAASLIGGVGFGFAADKSSDLLDSLTKTIVVGGGVVALVYVGKRIL